jgi:hypothetical protein
MVAPAGCQRHRTEPVVTRKTPISGDHVKQETVMRKSNTKMWAIGVVALLVAGSAIAGTPGFNARQAHQRERIGNGVQNGELTMRETRRLAAGQVHLNRVERRAKADGVVTRAERAHLQHEANQQSRRIYRQKHDRQDRN